MEREGPWTGSAPGDEVSPAGRGLNVLPRVEEHYRQACEFVAASIDGVGRGRLPDLKRGSQLIQQAVASLEQGSELLLMASERTQEFDVSPHCVNVAVFVLHMAPALGYPGEMRERAAMVALLHEVGVSRLPAGLLQKKEALSNQEMEMLRQRPVESALVLEGLGPDFEWLARAVGQVYEREDGSGLPRGLPGSDICEEARVVGLADLFEACIHNRPHRRAITGYQAVLELTSRGSHLFPDRIIKALLRSFSLYPHNEFVRLNSGEIAKVIEVNRDNLFRPVVRVVYRKTGEPLPEPRTVDLSQTSSLYVAQAITAEALDPQVIF